MKPRVLTAAAAGLAAAGAARVAYAALKGHPPGGEKTWARTNHRGEPVTLLEGPAVALGAIAVQILHTERSGASHIAYALVPASAGLGALCFGIVDDLAGSGKRRGLRGHLSALAHGEVTTGAVKLVGIGATGIATALLARGTVLARGTGQARGTTPGAPAWGGSSPPHSPLAPLAPLDIAIDSGLIAGGANLLNLFDLRPGRAIKVATASAALIAGGSAVTGGGADGMTAVAAPLGAALALLPEDLGERAMLGDAGANAVGAMLGAAAAVSLPRPARIGLLAGIVALTAASEKVSFTKIIERTPPLRWLDMIGRRPPAPPRQEP